MIPSQYRHIVVEGPIGIGKTTLASKLAERFGLATVLEDVGRNPFLPGFYPDIQGRALATQLSFLMMRIQATGRLVDMEGPVVSDFLLARDPLFARLLLRGPELDLYQQLFEHLVPHQSWPDLVIYLQAPPQVLLERIRRRGRDFERDIPAGHVTAVAEAYAEFFHRYDASPLLVINNVHLNIVDQPADFDTLCTVITEHRGGREFFNVGG